MNFLSKLISPKLGLTIVKSQLEKHFNKDIEKFDMIYYGASKTIDFKVFGKRHNYVDGKQLCDIIDGLIKDKMENNAILDFVIIHYDEVLSCDVYTTLNNERTHLNFII